MPKFVNIEGFQIVNKTYTYVVQLGGLDKLLEYYKAGKSFRDIRSIGEKTALELSDLCKQLLSRYSKGNSFVYPKAIDFSDIKSVDILYQVYRIERDKYSKRTKDLLDWLEMEFELSPLNNAHQALLRFIVEEEYLRSRRANAGQKVLMELEQIRYKLIHFNPDDESIGSINNARPSLIDFKNVAIIFKVYNAERSLLSQRTQNVLDRLEEEFKLSNKDEKINEFLQFIIDEKYLEHPPIGAGEMVFQELRKLRERLLQFNITDNSKSLATNESPSMVSHLNNLYPNADLSSLLVNDVFSLERVAGPLLIKSKFSSKVGQVVEWLFFKDEDFNFKEIAENTGTTPETVRTTFNKFTENIFPKLIETVMSFGNVAVECNR